MRLLCVFCVCIAAASASNLRQITCAALKGIIGRRKTCGGKGDGTVYPMYIPPGGPRPGMGINVFNEELYAAYSLLDGVWDGGSGELENEGQCFDFDNDGKPDHWLPFAVKYETLGDHCNYADEKTRVVSRHYKGRHSTSHKMGVATAVSVAGSYSAGWGNVKAHVNVGGSSEERDFLASEDSASSDMFIQSKVVAKYCLALHSRCMSDGNLAPRAKKLLTEIEGAEGVELFAKVQTLFEIYGNHVVVRVPFGGSYSKTGEVSHSETKATLDNLKKGTFKVSGGVDLSLPMAEVSASASHERNSEDESHDSSTQGDTNDFKNVHFYPARSTSTKSWLHDVERKPQPLKSFMQLKPIWALEFGDIKAIQNVAKKLKAVYFMMAQSRSNYYLSTKPCQIIKNCKEAAWFARNHYITNQKVTETAFVEASEGWFFGGPNGWGPEKRYEFKKVKKSASEANLKRLKEASLKLSQQQFERTHQCRVKGDHGPCSEQHQCICKH